MYIIIGFVQIDGRKNRNAKKQKVPEKNLDVNNVEHNTTQTQSTDKEKVYSVDKSYPKKSKETDDIENGDHEDNICDEEQSEDDFNHGNEIDIDMPLAYDDNSGFDDDDYPENQEVVTYKDNYDTTNPMMEISCNDQEKATTVTPSQKENGLINFTLSEDNNNPIPFSNTECILELKKKTKTSCNVENDSQKSEQLSALTARSLGSKLETYNKEQLLQYIISIKNGKECQLLDIEEINEMTLISVIKCSKYELFKRIQFIRHQNVLKEYEKKGSIGRFVMNKLKIDKKRRKVFWNTYYPMVRKGIKNQRNVIHTNIRRKFIGK